MLTPRQSEKNLDVGEPSHRSHKTRTAKIQIGGIGKFFIHLIFLNTVSKKEKFYKKEEKFIRLDRSRFHHFVIRPLIEMSYEECIESVA